MPAPKPLTSVAEDVNDVRTAYEIEALHKEIDELKKKVESLASDRDSALRWGIVMLGTAVIGMGTWIFNFVAGHTK